MKNQIVSTFVFVIIISGASADDSLTTRLSSALGFAWNVSDKKDNIVRIRSKEKVKLYRPAEMISAPEGRVRNSRKMATIVFTLRFAQPAEEVAIGRNARILSAIEGLEDKMKGFKGKGTYRPRNDQEEALYTRYIGLLKGNQVESLPVTRTALGDVFFTSNFADDEMEGWALLESSDKFFFWGAIFTAIAMTEPIDDYTVNTRDIADIILGDHPISRYRAKRRAALKIEGIRPIALPEPSLYPDGG